MSDRKLLDRVRDVLDASDFNSLSFEERKRIGKYMTQQQILTLWQVLESHKDLTNERWRKQIRAWLENCIWSYTEENR